MKSKKESALYRYIREISEDLPSFKIADKADYPTLLDLIEGEGMKINGIGNLYYSRKPDLLASFQESGHDSVMITDTTCSFFCAISEIQVSIKDTKESAYYISDFRVNQKINWRIKAQFRKAYIKLLKKLNKKCFTAIINSNTPAVQALTSKRSKLNYRKYFNYRTESILINPLIKLVLVKYNFKVLPIGKVPINSINFFLKKKRKESSFSLEHNRNEDAYVILDGSNIVAYISIKKPSFRNLFIKPSNKILKLIFAINRSFFNLDYSKKIPCTYVTQFLVDGSYDINSLFCIFLKYFYKVGVVQTGHLFMLSHNYFNLKSKLSIFLFQTTTEAKMYNLSNYDMDEINDVASLNLMKL